MGWLRDIGNSFTGTIAAAQAAVAGAAQSAVAAATAAKTIDLSGAAKDAVGAVRSESGGQALAVALPAYAVLTETGRQGLVDTYGPIIQTEASAIGGPAAGAVVGAGQQAAANPNDVSYQTTLPTVAGAVAVQYGADPMVAQQVNAAIVASIDPATIQAMLAAEIREQLQAAQNPALAAQSSALTFIESNAVNMTPAQLEAAAIAADSAHVSPGVYTGAVGANAPAITQTGSATMPPAASTGSAAAAHADAAAVAPSPIITGYVPAVAGDSPNTQTPPGRTPVPESTTAAYLATEARSGEMSPAQLQAHAEALDALGGNPPGIASAPPNANQQGASGGASPAPPGSLPNPQPAPSTIPTTTPKGLMTAAIIGIAVVVAIAALRK